MERRVVWLFVRRSIIGYVFHEFFEKFGLTYQGWDWGPVLMTAGPWRPVRLEISHTHISNVRVDYDVSDDLSTITGKIAADIEGLVDEIIFTIGYEGQDILRVTQKAENGTNSSEFKLGQYTHSSLAYQTLTQPENPNLWYPAGYGEQCLYSVAVNASYQGTVLNTWETKTGFRKSQLVQEQDDHGQSFYFRINNIDVFCGGSCWIPAHSLLPSLDPDKYRAWLQLMIDGNQVMTRYVPLFLSMRS